MTTILLQHELIFPQNLIITPASVIKIEQNKEE